MDHWLLSNVLECSVCLEQLGPTSKVLPCQHTFCRSCLEDIVNTHKELRCPECRTLVKSSVDGLPTNILLMRILEGIKNVGPPTSNSTTTTSHVKSSQVESSKIAPYHAPQPPGGTNAGLHGGHLSTAPSTHTTAGANITTSSILASPFGTTGSALCAVGHRRGDIGSGQFPNTSPFIMSGQLSGDTLEQSDDSTSRTLFNSSVVNSAMEGGSLRSSSVSSPAVTSVAGGGNTRSNSFSTPVVSSSSSMISGFSSLRSPHTNQSSTGCNPQPSSLPPIVGQQRQNTGLHPCARALFNYDRKEPRDLSFKKGDLITLRKKIDANWFQGEINGQVGFLPVSYVQVLTPLPTHIPQCKALYDFKMTNDEERDCLTFNKGDIITVLRRVDENWAEGKLSSRIGIFPLSFVDLNSAAKALMKLSLNAQQGPSRVAPPTPIVAEGESTPLILSDGGPPSCHAPSPPVQPSDSSSSSSTITSPAGGSSSSLTTSPSSPSLPSSPPTSTSSSSSSTLAGGGVDFSTSASSSSSTSTSTSMSASVVRVPSLLHHHYQQQQQQQPQQQQQREKRHSFTSVGAHNPSPPRTPSSVHRHSLEIASPSEEGSSPSSANFSPTIHSVGVQPPASDSETDADISTSSRSNSTTASSSLHTSGSIPQSSHTPMYIALYTYRPRKADELELRKGHLYTVTEKCQDGWCKGRCVTSNKAGVFPGNYVHLAKPHMIAAYLEKRKARSSRSTSRDSSSGSSAVSSAGLTQGSSSSVISYTRPRVNNKSGSKHNSLSSEHRGLASSPPSRPPELPPRSVSSSQSAASWHASSPPSSSSSNNTQRPHVNNTVTPPPNMVVGESCSIPSHPPAVSPAKHDKRTSKDRGSSGNGSSSSGGGAGGPGSGGGGMSLMKKLTSSSKKNKSKSPPPCSYSMDNPVFEDITVTPSLQPQHIRSGSNPDSIGVGVSCTSTSSVTATSTIVLAGTHQKECGATDISIEVPRRAKQPAPLIKERFRCIVPYPPNSEYELELQLGDIIYVHKKREDGWYKGTLQRTGKTGLFPASFVEAC